MQSVAFFLLALHVRKFAIKKPLAKNLIMEDLWVISAFGMRGIVKFLLSCRSRRVQRDMRRVLGLPNSFAASAIAGMKSDTHLLHRKAGVRIQRMKSFSCPQLLISSPEVSATRNE